MNTALAILTVLTASLIHTLAPAQAGPRAQLRVAVVDQANAPVPGATVMVFTLDGELGRTAVADEKGVAVFSDLPVGLTEVYAKSAGHRSYAEAAKLKGGANVHTATLTLTADHGEHPVSGS